MAFVALSQQNNQQILSQLISESVIVDPQSPKGRLLNAAATLFRDRGFDKTTVRDLAKAIGIQSGSLFHHYPNKQEILKQVMQQAIMLNIRRVEMALSLNHTIKDKLLALILCEFQALILDTSAHISVLVFEWRSLSEDNQAIMLKLRDEYEQYWLDVLAQAKQQGMINIDHHILRRLLNGAINWSLNWYKADGDLSLEQLADMTLQMVLNTEATKQTTIIN
ncbi:TetR/AcrR family transcriptional regulator [Psychrobium sp. MM17-31]|uniref:TetR/AcrR family transcriptional regulator n=1 Tax=Psychrobium sp. MM17-31 TaxID=2917758 RepID=UPI001EF40824|nr:TetR/AcrR family transcriptional regulator [Psychrobium sp. MM17-31]MCG7533315.1 TetR/AcrR family transcriptional regulator [Psychrobium sp. MM17-31]